MVPIEKVKNIIVQYDTLEKELSSGSVDPKLFAKSLGSTLPEDSSFSRVSY